MTRSLHRACAVVVSAVLAAVFVYPGQANADSAIPDANTPSGVPVGIDEVCPNDPNIRWEDFTIPPGLRVEIGIMYTIVSSTPTFFVSDGRTVQNHLDQPISATFTSSQTRTVSVTVSMGTSAQLTEKLQSSINVSIQRSRSTAIGVNATLTVNPHTRVTGQYGVEGFRVVYDATQIWRFGGECLPVEVVRSTTDAPTVVEGWRFTSAPI